MATKQRTAVAELKAEGVLPANVVLRTSKYLNNLVEQDHRGIKQRYYPMQGFGAVESAQRFCQAYDEGFWCKRCNP